MWRGGWVASRAGFELRDALLSNERRGRLTEAECASFLRDLSRLPVTVDVTPDEVGVLSIARRHRLSVYDASYLELARRAGLALAALDTDLARAAQAEHVGLLREEPECLGFDLLASISI